MIQLWPGCCCMVAERLPVLVGRFAFKAVFRFQPSNLSTALYMLLLADLVTDTTFMRELLVPLLLAPSLQLTTVPQTPMLLVHRAFLLADGWVFAKPGSGP